MTNRYSPSLIKLADNPVEPEYYGGQEGLNKMTMSQTNKGRKVGPGRTKLAAEDRFDRIERAIGTLAKSVEQVVSVQRSALNRAGGFDVMDDYDEEEDPMDIGMPDMEGEDELALSVDGYLDSDFDAYGGTEDTGEPDDEDTEQELPTSGQFKSVRKARINRARISKDNEASSFGEKDDDIPGNRPLNPDHKDRPATDYLIQGPSDEGPGPISKAVLRKAVQAELRRMGVARAVTSPAPGGSQINKAATSEPSMMDLVETGRHLSFRELNNARFGGIS